MYGRRRAPESQGPQKTPVAFRANSVSAHSPVPRAGIGGNGGVARKAPARAESLPGDFSHRLEDAERRGSFCAQAEKVAQQKRRGTCRRRRALTAHRLKNCKRAGVPCELS